MLKFLFYFNKGGWNYFYFLLKICGFKTLHIEKKHKPFLYWICASYGSQVVTKISLVNLRKQSILLEYFREVPQVKEKLDNHSWKGRGHAVPRAYVEEKHWIPVQVPPGWSSPQQLCATLLNTQSPTRKWLAWAICPTLSRTEKDTSSDGSTETGDSWWRVVFQRKITGLLSKERRMKAGQL